MIERVTRIARACALHPWRVLTVALLVSLLAGFAAARLPVHTSRQALLPQDTDVSRRLNSYLDKFGAASDLVVVLENAPRDVMERFASDLAEQLRSAPEIEQVTERLEPRFFLQHAYLLMPAAQLSRLEEGLANGGADVVVGLSEILQKADAGLDLTPSMADADLGEVRASLKAMGGLLDEWQRWLEVDSAPSALDWNRLAAALGAGELGSGYFASHDGRMLFLFVHPKNYSSDFESLQPFNETVRRVASSLVADYRAQGRSPPEFGLTGLPAIEYEEYIDIEEDIRLVIWTAAGLIAALILLVVRSLRWALAIFIPMGLGALWSLALAWLSVGHLTIITSSFLAILFGLGADYGIFSSSRIADERRAGAPLVEAIATGIGASFPALLTAGGASLFIFGALATVDFPGFAELGLVAAGGVLLILISTWFVQPAIYALFPPRIRELSHLRSGQREGRFKGGYPRSVAWLLVLAAVGAAAIGIERGLRLPFDYDVLALLPADSKAAQYQRRMVTETDYQSEVVIFTASDMAEARRITEEASRLPSIARVQSVTQFFPADAGQRLEKARELGVMVGRDAFSRQLDRLDHEGLPETDFKRLLALLDRAQGAIDEGEEQAFSAGHADLVEQMEALRGRLESIRARMTGEPERARMRTEMFYRALLAAARNGLALVRGWSGAAPLTPDDLPRSLHDRFVASDGTLAAYAFPARSVYDPDYLDQLVRDVYGVSPEATGFPTTHQVFSKAVVDSFSQGTLLAIGVCLLWLMLVLRSFRGFVLASLPLLIGGGWMLGFMAWMGLRYNYANIIALPLVIALAVDYGVWYSHRWRELEGWTPFAITLNAGKVIALAAGTELAGLGAITLASYRGVSSLGVDITIGLLCCLMATFLIAPAIGQFLMNRGSREK